MHICIYTYIYINVNISIYLSIYLSINRRYSTAPTVEKTAGTCRAPVGGERENEYEYVYIVYINRNIYPYLSIQIAGFRVNPRRQARAQHLWGEIKFFVCMFICPSIYLSIYLSIYTYESQIHHGRDSGEEGGHVQGTCGRREGYTYICIYVYICY